MAEINKNTVLAILAESTEGTVVSPSAATDFIAVQDNLSMEPGIESIENAELHSSLGMAKSIRGVENPKASLSHYVRHSGTEGSAPNYKQLLKAAFGSETVNGTQRSTTSSSSTSVVKLASGGTDFARGRAILIKDGTNGYSIRPVFSVSTNDLTLGFNLANAPASGIGVGKCVNYSPANSSHQSLSLWRYAANRGAVELISGCRVTELSMDFKANDLINGSYSLEGLKYYFNPIEITTSIKYLDFLDDATTRAAIIPVKVYRDPHELADAIASAMNSLGSSNTFTCTYSNSTGKFTITSSGTTLTLKWNTGTNTANSIASKIGFSTAADSSAALTYTGTNAITLTASYTPSFDSADPLVCKNLEVFLGDSTDSNSISVSQASFKMALSRAVINDITAESGRSGSLIDKREVTISLSALLNQFDAEKFKRYRANTDTSFCLNFGLKTGNNWVAGKCGCLYIPTASISSFKVESDNGIFYMNMELKAFVDSSGNGEVYLNFL